MNWRDLGDAASPDFQAALKGTPLESSALAFYQVASPHTILLLAQLGHESDFGRSDLAGICRNPLGLRPRNGGSGFLTFDDFPSAVREWKARITDPAYAYASTTTVEQYVHVYAPASDGNDEQAYVRAIQDAFVRYGATSHATGGVSAMGLYPVAGLAQQISLPVPLIQAIIPAGQTNQRPGIKRQTPGYWVQHETANTAAGADAAMHARYLAQGADGSQVSWHFTVDDHQIYQHIPIDEVTWQAADGAGPGNMSGVSCEMAVNSDGNEATARTNTEALAGAICKALGLGVDRVKRHYDFNAADPNRHFCPQHMMQQNYWPTFVANVGKIIQGGTVSVPAQPAVAYPAGLDKSLAASWFGKVTGDDKKVYAFDENGPVSQAWITNGAATGQYPALISVQHFDVRAYFRFANGLVLWQANANDSVKPLTA